MLCDLTIIPADPSMTHILSIIARGRDMEPVRLAQGVYQLPHWSPQYHFAEKLVESYEKLPRYEHDQTEEQRAAQWREYISQQAAKAEKLRQFYLDRYGREPYKSVHDDAPDYGVVDSPEQLLELFPHLADDDVPRAITMVKIERANQPESGGWRYHKWGPYLGTQNPEHEYLFHDKHIDAVWTFSIYELEMDEA